MKQNISRVGMVVLATQWTLLSACGSSTELVRFETGQEAEAVIGQTDFTSSGTGTTATTFSDPYGATATHNGRLYLVDLGNNRVMGYNEVPRTNGAAASFVLGQADLVSSSSGTTASTLNTPSGVGIGSGALAIADASNNRVLLYNSIPSASNASANVVIGQSDMTSFASGCTQNTLNFPEAALPIDGKLLVADSNNHRVLIYNSIPSSNGAAASVVLGQADFTTCTANRGGSVGANTLRYPSGVWSDGEKLLVTDSLNNRVLIWNRFPTTSGQAADVVLGQSDFTTATSATTASTFDYPNAAFSNGRQIFVPDFDNNRLLIWNSFPSENGTSADVVLGQPDFTSAASTVSTTSLGAGASSAVLVGKRLIVGSSTGKRYLIFKGR